MMTLLQHSFVSSHRLTDKTLFIKKRQYVSPTLQLTSVILLLVLLRVLVQPVQPDPGPGPLHNVQGGLHQARAHHAVVNSLLK